MFAWQSSLEAKPTSCDYVYERILSLVSKSMEVWLTKGQRPLRQPVARTASTAFGLRSIKTRLLNGLHLAVALIICFDQLAGKDRRPMP